MMQCPRCLNTDPEYFYKGSRGWYCRRCIAFGRAMITEEEEAVSLRKIPEGAQEYTLKYPLTQEQQIISHQCAQEIEKGDVLLHAVCGAGKTELVVETIAKMLESGRKICFAIARRQVVLEVAERLQEYFVNADVVPVCGGHTEKTDGDLIVCTCHQLYRYHRAFDCLILDEPDAFPYRGNDVLHGIAQTSVRGHIIYLTATPDEELRQRVRLGTLKELTLRHRPHGRPVPVPHVVTAPYPVLLILLLRWITDHSAHPRMVFVPSVRAARVLHLFLSAVFDCDLCTGRTENRDEVIAGFRRKPVGLIVATTVLERGVTIPGADICVWDAANGVFDEAALIQMSGRAGRSFDHPDGDVLFLCHEKSSLVRQCRESLQEVNQ